MAGRLKESGGQKYPLAAELVPTEPVTLSTAMQIRRPVRQPEKVVGFYLDAGRHLCLQQRGKLLLEGIVVIIQGKLAPAKGEGAGKNHANAPFYFAVRLDLDIGAAQFARRLVRGTRRQKQSRSSIRLPDTRGGGVFPMQIAKGRISFPGVEELLFPSTSTIAISSSSWLISR